MKQLFIVAIAAFFMTIQADAQKLGHIDGQALLEALPEMKTISTQLETQANELKGHLENMRKEYEAMYNEYVANQGTWPEVIKQSKQQKIIDQEKAMADFEESANTEIARRQEELLKPVLEKTKVAIEEVGKEKGFTYIFDTSQGVLLYLGGEDIAPLVKAKLGVPAE